MNDVLRLLLLEDSPIDVELIKYELRKLTSNYELKQSNNRNDFLNKVREFSPHIILSDYTLPQYTGLEALEDAKKIDENIIFIMVTGTLDEETAVQCMKSGASDYVLKSSLVRLIPAIEAALEKQRSKQEKEQTEQALRDSENKYKTLVEHSPDAIVVFDLDEGRFIEVNRQATLLFEKSKEELLSCTLKEFNELYNNDDKEAKQLRRYIKDALNGNIPTFEWTFSKNQEQVTGEVRLLALPSKNRRLIRGSVIDITARKKAEAQLLHDALHDKLTGLPNRTYFLEILEKCVRNTEKRPKEADRYSVLLIDIDRFQLFNDSLGHQFGDQLLIQIAQRIRHHLPEGTILARLGGDEFVVLLRHHDPIEITQKLQAGMQPPFEVDDHQLFTSMSIGIITGSPSCKKAEEILRNADIAMYQAKKQGGNSYQIFRPPMHKDALAFLKMETDLRRAIENEEFALYYQPQQSLKTGQIVGMEALIRWNHPEKGPISPELFISVAEKTQLILPLGEWVLKTAALQNKRWHDEGFDNLKVSVNVSALQFRQSNIANLLAEILEMSQLNPHFLELELTEGIMMKQEQKAISTLNALHALGLQLSIDDFGTGYSSLAYLKRFPLDTLKIDKAFINEITSSSQDAAITDAIIQLAHSLNLNVIAEGVETIQQIEFLKEHHCDVIQGHYLSPPLPAEEALAFLRSHR